MVRQMLSNSIVAALALLIISCYFPPVVYCFLAGFGKQRNKGALGLFAEWDPMP